MLFLYCTVVCNSEILGDTIISVCRWMCSHLSVLPPARLLPRKRDFSMSNQCLSQAVQSVSEISLFCSDFVNIQEIFPSSEPVGSDFCFDLNQKSAFIKFSKPSFSTILQCRILKNHLENKSWVSRVFLFLSDKPPFQ